MTERQWEIYRLSVVEEWQESPHKAAVVEAIKHKLMILALQEKNPSTYWTLTLPPQNHVKPRRESVDQWGQWIAVFMTVIQRASRSG